MPFVTFSRNFKRQRRAKRLIKIKDAVVELRGAKTVDKVVEHANENGFKKVLILTSLVNGSATAQEINISRHSPPVWKFGKERKMVIR